MPTTTEIQNTLDASQLSYEIEQIVKSYPHLSHDELIQQIIKDLTKSLDKLKSTNLTFKDFQYDPATGATIVAFVATYENGEEKLILGVTGSQEFWKDWVGADGTLLLSRGEVNVQMGALYQFTKKMLEQYSKDKIILTGHSLGGSGALIIAYLLNINALTYNAAPVGTSITGLFSPPEYAINFISEKDALNSIAKFLPGHQDYKNIWLKNGKGHDLEDLNVQWTISAMATIIAVERGLLSPDQLIQFGVDVDGDGLPDVIIVRKPEQLTPFNLLAAGILSGSGRGGPIEITPESLSYLASSIRSVISTDISWLLENLLISMQSNQNIISQKDTRVEDIITKVDDELRGFGIVHILELIHFTFDRLTNQTAEGQYNLNVFESLAFCKPQRMFEPLVNIPNLIVLRQGAQVFDLNYMEHLISKIATTSQSILDTVTQECIHMNDGRFLYNVPTITATELSTFYESIKPKVEVVFQGLGNRSNFNDGIAQGLGKLFDILALNMTELHDSLDMLASVSEQLVDFFVTQDEAIASAIASTYAPKIDSIPSFDVKTAQLHESKEFEDMAVIQAKDEQIETKGKELSDYLMGILPLIDVHNQRIFPYIDLMRELRKLIEEFLAVEDEKITAEVRETYDEWKEVSYMDWVDYEEKTEWRWVEQERTKVLDLGTVGGLAGGHLDEMKYLYGSLQTLMVDFESLSGTIAAFTAKYDQTSTHTKRMIENAVYSSMGMSDVVSIQKLSAQVVERMVTQFKHVSQSLYSENKGVAIETLISLVNKNIGSLGFYLSLLQTYFGDQV